MPTPEARRQKHLVYLRGYYADNRENLRAASLKRYDPARRAANQRRQKHGMTPEQYAAEWDSQAGRCYLCGKDLASEKKAPAVDHDHACCAPTTSCAACRRGLACERCNRAIGLFGDDPDLMEQVAANLRAQKAAVRERLAAKPVQAELPIDINRAARRREESTG